MGQWTSRTRSDIVRETFVPLSHSAATERSCEAVFGLQNLLRLASTRVAATAATGAVSQLVNHFLRAGFERTCLLHLKTKYSLFFLENEDVHN